MIPARDEAISGAEVQTKPMRRGGLTVGGCVDADSDRDTDEISLVRVSRSGELNYVYLFEFATITFKRQPTRTFSEAYLCIIMTRPTSEATVFCLFRTAGIGKIAPLVSVVHILYSTQTRPKYDIY